MFLLVAVNGFLLFSIRSNTIDIKPLSNLDISKPTFILIVDEFECASCVEGLFFLNDIYSTLSGGNNIDFLGIILSKEKTDSKNIARAFAFPFLVTDDYRILKRLNINRTPLMIGLSTEHRIFYSDVIPVETGVNEEYIKKGILDRLYFSLR